MKEALKAHLPAQAHIFGPKTPKQITLRPSTISHFQIEDDELAQNSPFSCFSPFPLCPSHFLSTL